jgi:threonine dehydratase
MSVKDTPGSGESTRLLGLTPPCPFRYTSPYTTSSPESRSHVTTTHLLRQILTSRVYDVARQTPLEEGALLSRRLGNTVLLKREDLQPVFSFKLRGAYNRIAHLSEEERERGIIAASAGNHAQGVAYSARRLGIRAVIVMPGTTPQIKVEAVRAMGAEVILAGDTYPEAQAHGEVLAEQMGLAFIHPFDDPLVIAGQGTVADEIVRDAGGELHAVFVPVGGGGLIAGIASYLKELLPTVKVIGVEPFEADAMYRSLEAGRRIRLPTVGIFADGVAVQEVGETTFAIARETVDGVVRVTNDEICAAIKDIFEDTRSIMEPAGALGVAGMKRWIEETGVKGKRLVPILSGANINFERLRFVAERAELGEAREAVFAVTIPELPGAFREFCGAFGRRVVTEFNYRLNRRDAAHIFVGISVESRDDAAGLARELNARGYEAVDLSENEMAKLHVRHMVGGPAPESVENEIACRFEFPERPGALLRFLDTLGGRWNISLFHYRNHGADFGRVLAGFEVPEAERGDFIAFLDTLGYPYTLEPENVAYRMFLG